MLDSQTCTTCDSVVLNFSENSLQLLDITLAVIMFGVALSLHVSDFRRVVQAPRAPLAGLLSQLVLLPALTLGLVWLLRPCPSMALGMLLVAACPGGNVSNFISLMARGNVALSVSLTAITTLGAIVMTPINFAFWSSLYPSAAELLSRIRLDPWGVFEKVLLILALPLLLGMWVRHRFPALADRIEKPMQRISMVIFLGYVVAALTSNYDFFLRYVQYVFLIVLLHNALAFGGGYVWGRLWRLPEADSRTLAIETGIQNSGLALVVIFDKTLFNGLGGMAMIAALWGIWHILAGMSLAYFWSRREPV
ncbi:MAG: bile acid:sodium symporter family protein [Bacteroidia bacterium]